LYVQIFDPFFHKKISHVIALCVSGGENHFESLRNFSSKIPSRGKNSFSSTFEQNFFIILKFESGSIWFLTLIGKFLGNFWGRFTGKLIHQKIIIIYSVFLKPGRELDRFAGKLIQTKCYISYMVSVKKFEWMSFPVKWSAWSPRIKKKTE